MEEEIEIADFNKIRESIFTKDHNLYKGQHESGIYILPLVYNMLNSVGNILFECSR